MGSFQSGFYMGGSLANQAIRNAMEERELALREAADKRATERHDLEIAGLRRTEDATANLDRVTRLGVQNPAAISANNADFDAAVEATGRGLPMPPAAPMQSEWRPATERELNQAQMGLAAAKGDMNGLAALTAARRQLDIGDIASRVMKTPTAELERLAPDITASGYPLLYTGKDKNGYTFLKTEADGKTPIPGSQFKLNESQLRQMALAHELGNAGFGTEALNTLNAAHKDLGDHIAKWNTTLSQAATANNTATHYGNQDQSARITANAAATNAQTNSDLRKEQIRGLQFLRENREEALKIMEDYDRLTPEQQAGPEGQALVQRFNTINVKAGGTVALQAKGKTGPGNNLLARGVDQKKNDDGTYTAFDKATGQALYNTLNGEPIPLGMDTDTYQGMKKAAQSNGVKLVAGEDNGRLVLKFQGADGQYYDDPAKAKYAKPQAGGAKPDATPDAALRGGLKTPPTMEQTQAQGRAVSAFVAQAKQAMAADPEVAALTRQYQAAVRAGRGVEINNALAKRNELIRDRYNLTPLGNIADPTKLNQQ